MALNFTVSYTFSPNTTISSSQVNTNTSDVANVFTGLEALTKTFAKLKVDADPTTVLEVATKQYVDVYATWKRPQLVYASTTAYDVEANTGTANQTKIVFPDGNARTVTEDTTSTHKYRRFDVTATAEFTSGTEDSGLRSGISEANNTWYAIYAVKSQINSANFVLAGDTTYPTTATYSTLNTRYGSNCWVYLGMVVNGNNAGSASSLIEVVQAGNFFKVASPTTSGMGVNNVHGLLLATASAAASITYTYSSGTALPNLPSILTLGLYGASQTANAVGMRVQNSDANADISTVGIAGAINSTLTFVSPLSKGVKISSGDGGNENFDVFLAGWLDPVLTSGSNPVV